MSWQGGQLIGISPRCFLAAIRMPNAKLREYEFPYLAKPYRVAELLSEAAIAITQATFRSSCCRTSIHWLIL
jgi:hypothetical protein